MKGKIKTISPRLVNGTQETFTFKDRTYYVFTLAIDIEGKGLQLGDANSTSPDPKWKLDEECEVTIEQNDKATNNQRFKLDFGNRPGGGTASGRSYGKPVEERMEIISQNAFSSAIQYINSLDADERKALIDKYGPDDAYVNFAISISNKIMDNAKRLKETYGS